VTLVVGVTWTGGVLPRLHTATGTTTARQMPNVPRVAIKITLQLAAAAMTHLRHTTIVRVHVILIVIPGQTLVDWT
jgi:hypothetical protein